MAVSRWRCAVALPLGMLIGRVPLVRQLLDPTIQILRPIPVTAWLPLCDDHLRARTALGLFPRLARCVLSDPGQHHLRRALGRAAAVRGGQHARLHAARRSSSSVVLPAALPSIFTGMRLGLGFAWVVIVVGEMTGVQTGLGAIIMEARQLSRTEIVISGMIVIGAVRLPLRPARDVDRTPPAGLESLAMAEAPIPILELKNAGKIYSQSGRSIEALRGANLTREEGRIHLPDRRLRLRQVHPAAHGRGFRGGDARRRR